VGAAITSVEANRSVASFSSSIDLARSSLANGSFHLAHLCTSDGLGQAGSLRDWLPLKISGRQIPPQRGEPAIIQAGGLAIELTLDRGLRRLIAFRKEVLG
jgi:hypothetical protein